MGVLIRNIINPRLSDNPESMYYGMRHWDDFIRSVTYGIHRRPGVRARYGWDLFVAYFVPRRYLRFHRWFKYESRFTRFFR